jgi:hypothetical protein
MYLSSHGQLIHLKSDAVWVEQAAYVFEGDFSVEQDKHTLVDVILGLYGFMVICCDHSSRDDSIRITTSMLKHHRDRSFPDKYFDGLEVLLEAELAKVSNHQTANGAFTPEDLEHFLLVCDGFSRIQGKSLWNHPHLESLEVRFRADPGQMNIPEGAKSKACSLAI